MTSACIFKDTLRNDTQRGKIKGNPTWWKVNIIICSTNHFLKSVYSFGCTLSIFKVEDVSTNFSRIHWYRLVLCGKLVQSPKSTQTKRADCPQFNRDIKQQYPGSDNNIIHCIAWTINRYNWLWFQWTNNAIWIWTQQPIVPPSFNDLNLPPNPFKLLPTMAVANPKAGGHDGNYSPQSLEHSEPSPISTPPMNLSTIEGRETPHTTTDDITFYCDDETRRIYFLPSSPSPPPPRRKLKRKLSIGMSFIVESFIFALPAPYMLQHNCKTCGQSLPEPKDIPGSSSKN